MNDFVPTDAVISPCGRYRYLLTRERDTDLFGSSGESVNYTWVMLNPSTADASVDDPTIRRTYDFSSDASHIRVVNLSPLRATDPQELVGLSRAELLGDEAEWRTHLATAIAESDKVVCAWGATITINPHLAAVRCEVLDMLRPISDVVRLGCTKDGHPRHPFYVSGVQGFLPYKG